MSFEIIDNFELPATTIVRNRPKGTFSQALDSLEVEQGFKYESAKDIKLQYPKVSPKKFNGKRFKLALISVGANGVNTFGVKRVS